LTLDEHEASGYGCIVLPADRRDILDAGWTRSIRLRLYHPEASYTRDSQFVYVDRCWLWD
jgi:hypothetical protein